MKNDAVKHPRQSLRLKKYDYSKTGFYYETICSAERKGLFTVDDFTSHAGAGFAPARSCFPNIHLTRAGKIIEKIDHIK